MKIPTTLFLCTGNACRSQMAEGLARHYFPTSTFVSAGIEKHGLNLNAVKVLAESGIDISQHYSKTLDDVPELERVELVVTVCDHAQERCPVFPGQATVIHRGFLDPPKLAAAFSNEQQQLDCYRKVRDDIEQFVRQDLPRLSQSTK